LRLWKPAVFQGDLKRTGYFEGWYFKNVSADNKTAYAVIPAVSLSKDKSKTHAFIQFYDARGEKSYYFKFPLAEFWADEKSFSIKIGKNFFTLNRMQLDIDQDGMKIKADLVYRNTHSWPVSLLSPGSMGWYAFVPKMECYHGVLSFNNTIEGFIEVNGVRTEFTGGKGYIEKDWGTSMPNSWIWMQSNHFDEPEASFFGSIAKIPWMGNYFTGYLFGLYLKKKIYRFTTYTGAKVKGLSVNDDIISFRIEDSRYILSVKGERVRGAELLAPKQGEMTTKINETLNSKIDIEFYDKRKKSIIYAGRGINAGLEYVGNVEELIKGFK
jgi:tocopherol cyclase